MRFIVECDIQPRDQQWAVRIPIGTTTTDVYTSPTTQTVSINGSSVTASDKDVVIFKNHRYAWNDTLGRWLSPFDRDRRLYPLAWENYNDEKFVLWHPDRVNDDIRKGYCIYNMQVKKQINHADSFTFIMPKGHPAYDMISTKESTRLVGISVAVRWENSANCLFFGRVISISTDVYYQKTVTCEGAFAFLNDIMLRPTVFLSEIQTPIDPTKPAAEQDPETYAARTLAWWDYAQYAMRKHSARMFDMAKCHKRSFRFLERNSSFSPSDPEYDYLGEVYNAITENQRATTVYVRNVTVGDPNYGKQSYITPKQYDMVDYVDTSSTPARRTRFVCDDNHAVPNSYLIWRYPTPSEVQPARMISDNWSFTPMGIIIADHDKRWGGIDDYMPVMDAINDIIGTDSRYIGFADAQIGMGSIDPTDNRVRLYLEVYGPNFATNHTDTIMSLEKNVVDISESGNGFETYSVIIPLDKNKKTIDEDYNKGHMSEFRQIKWTDETSGQTWYSDRTDIYDVYDSASFTSDAGYIEKTVSFDDIDADTQNQQPPNPGQDPTYGIYLLKQRASEVLAQTGNTAVREYSISMVDLSLLSHVNREVFISHEGVTSGWGDHTSDTYLSPNNFINIGHRVHFVCDAYGITDDDDKPWICTSLDMSIDNPAASRYTFAIMDSSYIPNEGFKLSEQGDPSKSRTNTTSKPTSGAPVDKVEQPTDIVKIDDNHVVEFYPDKEVHYVADGKDDTRSNITSFEMPLGTTPITRGNPEPEPEE